MAVNTPLVLVSGEMQQISSANELGPFTGGTATGHAMTQDQFGTNSTQMTPAGNPTFAPGLPVNAYIGLIAHGAWLS